MDRGAHQFPSFDDDHDPGQLAILRSDANDDIAAARELFVYGRTYFATRDWPTLARVMREVKINARLAEAGLCTGAVTAAVAVITSRLQRAENVEWISWWLTVGCAYVGLGLVTWRARDRDVRRRD